METYQIITTVDITLYSQEEYVSSQLSKNQRANFNSLIQAIGLRSNLEWIENPVKHTGSLPEPITGKASHWIWEFITERDQVFLKDVDPVGHLLDDINGVPIIANLDDTVDLYPAAFCTLGNKSNIWIFKIG
jgi:hypothetical protein